MALTRLDNLYSSKTGKYLYVSPDDFNATDELDNRGNSPLRPFKTIQRAFIEVARYSYVPGSVDRFDQFSIMLMPGNHYIDNRPGLVDTSLSPEFSFDQSNNEWTDNSILDLSNSDNVLYKFNAKTGGAIVPRGCSLVGYDLRRTIIRPLYVPDPVDKDVERTSIFNLTGGCYLWQFTIKDGDLTENSPLFNSTDNVGKVYTQPEGTSASLKTPEFSHHKICIMEYAENQELDLYYEKIGKAFSQFQPTIDDAGELDPLVQENRIVGPLSDSRTIDSLRIDDIGGSQSRVTITTKIDHGYFEGQSVAVLNTELDEELNGTFRISIDSNNAKVFTYTLDVVSASLGLVSGDTYTTSTIPNALGASAISLAEIDSVESASPYVFNCSIRSTWGQCGMWANGSKATGFRSMVVAQYTGVSLQKDDRAFIRYDRFTNTWNQASSVDAFATVPYHTKGDAYWKDDWRNFHIRASDDAFIQCVSVFAVGFFDHFLMESGGDMSITNSNSNFGNTSLHAIGHKGFAFNQDKGGYITDIIPPKVVNDSRATSEKIQYYTFDILQSNDIANNTSIYLGSDTATNPEDTPAVTISGYRIGARANEKVYVKLDPITPGGNTEFNATLSPSGFKRYSTSLSTLNPPTISNFLDNYAQDAANQINNNKQFIQNEAYAYIINKYPTLDPDSPTFKGGIDITKCKRDIGYIVDAVVTDLRLTLNSFVEDDTSNINVIQAAEAYYVGGQLDYIENELTETLEAWDYVKNLSIAAMRNWDYLIGPVGGNPGCIISSGSDVIDVGDNTGLVVGMSVGEYTQNDFTNGKLNAGATPVITNIPAGITITELINNDSIRISQNAVGNNGNAFLYFDLTAGFYDTSVAPVSDDTIVQDTAYPECGNISTLIESYFEDISAVLGGQPVVRRESQINTDDLAVRATVFTVNTGGNTSNPHNFQTGTPVRLVPRAKAGTNPDKRLIRLPLGFNTNQKYYVIAPGRKTYPYDYSTGVFPKTATTQLLLATSPENAAAGIYIYSPETDTIDTDVEIDIYQYVLDNKYDLLKYTCNIAADGTISSDVSHNFDDPITVPQKIFFRRASDINDSTLPSIAGGAQIDDQTFFYAKYVKDSGSIPQKKFSVHTSFADAVSGANSITFQAGSGSNFYVFSDKRESPVRFDPTVGNSGLWYLNVLDQSSGNSPSNTSILARFHRSDYDDASGKIRTTDSWYERLTDSRVKEDRIYRFRYVIPQYLKAVRDPLNGFVLKLRTDDIRRLVPQRLVLKPAGSGAQFCELRNPSQSNEILGLKSDEYGNIIPSYDPYVSPVQLETNSKIAFNVQSARKTADGFLEITVFDHQAINANLKGKSFTVLKIAPPQGGTILASSTQSVSTNEISWTGNSSGTGYVQAIIEVPNSTEWYLVLKDVQGTIEYDRYNATTFTQGLVTTTLLAKPDSVGDPDGRSKSSRDDYLYAIPRAGFYTAVPGDIINVDGDDYYISAVTDAKEIEDTFYIFDIEELQERISGQQDGVYYLTAVRGNISPFPQGPGVGDNFKNFKFSQPISQLYPLDYKNDPLWFKAVDSTLVDPPETISAADNYVHGLVTVNDSKNSETKESTLDFINTLEINNLFTNTETDANGAIIDNRIRAQSGNATSGSEDRKIPIFGDLLTPSESKLYVELRRPSIARSGNHTFEYLGFGPGNYSTGFPLRQEVVLSDKQDFYAQAKREDSGIVFYTGLNSNGDLYIGNRKINAITGEETFLEAAVLESSEDDSDDLGGLVTTFETPVTFQDKITVEGDAFFNNPVEINVDATDEDVSLRIYSKVEESDDPTLSRSSFIRPNDGDIVLSKNRIDAAIFAFNPRGKVSDPGQNYSIRTHTRSDGSSAGIPTNYTPDQDKSPTSDQYVTYGGQPPSAGDILLKGIEVGSTGSLGWIYSNGYTQVGSSSIFSLQTFGNTIVRITWGDATTGAPISNENLGVKVGDLVKISAFSEPSVNGIWAVRSQNYSTSANFVEIAIQNNVAAQIYNWSNQTAAKLFISQSKWKELGVIGSESLRTNTDTLGNYKLGINTTARSSASAYKNAFVESGNTDPRANLDVVGNAFISGKELAYSNKSETDLDEALLVGGSSQNPNQNATFRVMTTNDGRVGINVSRDELTKTLVVNGDSSFTGDATFDQSGSFGVDLTVTRDLAVNGGDITTTAETFNLINSSVETLNFASTANVVSLVDGAETLTIANDSTGAQTIDIGTSATSSIITIGGATSTPQNSIFTVRNYQTILGGSLEIAAGSFQTDDNGSASQPLQLWTRNGAAAYVDAFTRAVQLRLGAIAGTTTIRNQFKVNGDAQFDGDFTINGGNNTGQLQVSRGQLGSTATSHFIGDINSLNVDYYRAIEEITEVVGIETRVDTAGTGVWSSTDTLLLLQTNQDGTGTVDGTLQDSVNGQSPLTGISIGDFLLIDSEIVEVVAPGPGQNPSSGAYEIPVARGAECTTAATHNDNTIITKLEKTESATFLTANITDSQQDVTLGEFGGAFEIGDYLRFSAGETCPSGEFVKIFDISLSDAKDFRINDGDGNDRFVVDSVCGAVTSTLTDVCDFTVQLTTNDNQFIVASNTSSTPELTISRDGTLTIVGDGALSTPAAVLGGTGSAAFTGDLLITSTNATDTTLDSGRLKLTQSSGDLDIAGGIDLDGDIRVYTGSTGINFTGTPTLQFTTSNSNFTINSGTTPTLQFVGASGDLTITGDFTVDGTVTTKIKADGSIDIGGVENYFTTTGGRKWSYIGTNSNSQLDIDNAINQGADLDVFLVSNQNYFVGTSGAGASDQLILLLPSNPQTGDMIRIVDVSGNTSNISQLVIRASSTRIQGDNVGSTIGIVGNPAVAYDGGELIINTPNAAFGLIYNGEVNSPPERQGWWLMEI